jgi:hypothetical protein
MKRNVFISALLLLELNISGVALPQQNYTINVNRPDKLEIKPVLEIRPRPFPIFANARKLYKEKEYYLLPAKNKKQTSSNKSSGIYPSVFILEAGNSEISVLHRKKSKPEKKGAGKEGLIFNPNSNLIKVPP